MELTDKMRTQLLTYPALSHAYRGLSTEYSSLNDRQSAGVTASWVQTNSFEATTCFGHAEQSRDRKINTSEKCSSYESVISLTQPTLHTHTHTT